MTEVENITETKNGIKYAYEKKESLTQNTLQNVLNTGTNSVLLSLPPIIIPKVSYTKSETTSHHYTVEVAREFLSNNLENKK